MALLTLLLATKRGCRLLETCRRFVNADPQLRLFLGTATRPRLPAKGFSSELRERPAASILSSAQANHSLERSKVVFHSDVFSPSPNIKAEVSLCLQRLLDLDVTESDRWVESYEGFAMIDVRDIPPNYEACIKAGFAPTTIKENPGILSHPCRILTTKIELIGRMGVADINDAVAFFYLGLTKLRALSHRFEEEALENGGVNRIRYMADRLEGRTRDVCNVVAKHYFLQTMPYSRLVLKLNIMLEHDIGKEDILSDIWGLSYGPELIMDRLKRARDAGISPIKPWMIRCPETCLSRKIWREKRQRTVLGAHETIAEYLSERLGCEKSHLIKNPVLVQVSGPKLESIIDFLLEKGYTKEQMVRLPRIFLHKLETMRERLEELTNYGHKPKSLAVFCKSQQEYEAYLKMVKRRFMAKNKK